MIYYQIEDVDAMFKDLCELEANDWIPKVVEEPSKRDNVNKTKKTFKAKARKSPVKGSNSLKAMMAAKRKEMKENAKNASAPMANAEEDGSAAAKKLQVRKIYNYVFTFSGLACCMSSQTMIRRNGWIFLHQLIMLLFFLRHREGPRPLRFYRLGIKSVSLMADSSQSEAL